MPEGGCCEAIVKEIVKELWTRHDMDEFFPSCEEAEKASMELISQWSNDCMLNGMPEFELPKTFLF
jgi:hypothetical protein